MTNGNSRNTFLDGITMDELVGSGGLLSPTDSSEDSVEVKVEAIASRSKRKLVEPRRLQDGPLKKRTCIRSIVSADETAPFRPWSSAPLPQYFRPPSPPPQAIDLIKRPIEQAPSVITPDAGDIDVRIPIHPRPFDSNAEVEAAIAACNEYFPKLQVAENGSCDVGALDDSQRRKQKNYKNMTRERRIEANARERTRVHTISAAFETLRHAVPAYSHSQKLSKLSVLRIACSYIATLSNLIDDDAHADLPASVEHVGRTIQREGKLRKKKEIE